MFQDGNAKYDIQTGSGYPLQRVRQYSFDGSDFGFGFEVRVVGGVTTVRPS